MNQDQVKDRLLHLEADVAEFSVIFSGKASKKVDGVYHPDTCEIILHNKNFITDNQIIYTAIHEFAHHIQCTRSPVPISNRAHTIAFWNTFHHLLYKAEELGIYVNVFRSDPEFVNLTRQIKERFVSTNGQLMKQFGELLLQAVTLCNERNVSFEDYVDRELGLHRQAAKTIMKTYTYNVNPEIGYENMKTVASVKDHEIRSQVEQAFLGGSKSPDMIKAEFSPHVKSITPPPDPLKELEAEKKRIQKTLDRLKVKLAEVEYRITELHRE